MPEEAVLEQTLVETTPEPVTVPAETQQVSPEPPAEPGREAEPPAKEPQEDLKEFDRSVSSRMKEYTKRHPELQAVFQRDPGFRNVLEATFRRESAYREIFPTVAEARQLREMFPNGAADVQPILQELDEIRELDQNLIGRDYSGAYPGHAKIIEDIYGQDRDAAVALFERLPKEWARLDPESYNRVFSSILASTFRSQGVVDHLARLERLASEVGNEEVKQAVSELARWVGAFLPDRSREESPESLRLKSERENLNRERAERERQDGERFTRELQSESVRTARQVVESHPLVRKLPQAIPAAKRTRIVNEVTARIGQFLGQNRSFVRGLQSAIESRDLTKALSHQKLAWSQPWLLNRYVRQVLDEETPGIVQSSAPRRAGTAAPRSAAPAAAREAPSRTGPYKQDGRWFHADGKAFTVAEILRGGAPAQ